MCLRSYMIVVIPQRIPSGSMQWRLGASQSLASTIFLCHMCRGFTNTGKTPAVLGEHCHLLSSIAPCRLMNTSS